MRVHFALSLVGIVMLATTGTSVANRRAARAIVQANPNTHAAGVLRNGVLTVTLEAKPSLWYLDGQGRVRRDRT
jgi:hypothetical protein